jgi:peptidyl-prolyl cis-trans isomerase C
VEAFLKEARALSARGLEVVAEPLPPVTADGRTLTPEPQQFDPTFARAAASLATRGDLSPVVATSFGVHVIMLLDRLPPTSISEEERRRMVREDVIVQRARAAQAKLMEELRRQPVTVAEGLDALLALVRTEP